jgi:hypothetical protein
VDVAFELPKKETPKLQFDDYALAFHFAAEWKDDQFPAASRSHAGESTSGGTVGEPMESYERDLLLYAHRDEPPFRTRVVSVPPAMATLTARFPAELVYESELRRIRLQCGAAGRTGRSRKFAVLTSETIFERSRIVVLNLVLRPLGDAPDESQLNEYDVIKLIKLWEGGEGRPATGWDKEILFETADGESKTLEETACQLFQDWLPPRDAENDRGHPSRARPRRVRHDPVQPAPPLAYRVGTVELLVPETKWRDQLFRDIAVLKEGGDAPDQKEQRARWNRVVAVGGVLQGLLDFRAISSDELADVFAEVDIEPDDESPSLAGFHKGTLLSLSAEAESDPDDDERPSPIGVDPYLAIPNVVLLHNEQRLKAARQLELRLSLGQPRRSASRSDRVDIDQTANGLDVMTGLLAQHLPNIFHYPAERRLYETGGHSRGFDDLETLIRLRREELASTLQRRERRRDRWTAVLAIVSAIVVGVVAAVQNLLVQEAIETLDWWVILIFAGFLYLAFFQLRNRLF